MPARCPNCGMPYGDRTLQRMNYQCRRCGAKVVPQEKRVFARIWIFLGVSAVIWLIVFISPPSVPHPRRMGALLTASSLVFFVGGILLEPYAGKKSAGWVAVAVAVAVGFVLKAWATT